MAHCHYSIASMRFIQCKLVRMCVCVIIWCPRYAHARCCHVLFMCNVKSHCAHEFLLYNNNSPVHFTQVFRFAFDFSLVYCVIPSSLFLSFRSFSVCLGSSSVLCLFFHSVHSIVYNSLGFLCSFARLVHGVFCSDITCRHWVYHRRFSQMSIFWMIRFV